MPGGASPRSARKTARTGQPRSPRARIGLALAGGGPLGAIYEVGALLALAESLQGVDLADLDVYVGVSSGGFVAAALANGISPAQMYRLFIAEDRDSALSPALFLRPAWSEFAHRALSVPRLTASALGNFLRDPLRRGALGSFAALGRAIPTGLFDQRAIHAFLARLFAADGRSNDFRRLRHKLFLVATNLDTGASVTFGTPGFDHVPIDRAIAASAALPGLFPPVEIDGEHYVDGALNKTLHASVALDEGVDLLLCVNPLVPFDANAAARRRRLTVEKIDHGGLPLVLAQTFRAIIHSRMKVGMEKYRRQYPHSDVLLFEPEREDADMFFANIFSYTHRARLCEMAYRNTRRRLLDQSDTLAPLLARHGIRLDSASLADAQRPVQAALDDPRALFIEPPDMRSLAHALARTLDTLERWLRGGRAPPVTPSSRQSAVG
ncbi:MAG TPA: patatin-like phospholipase family protein [Casimicrobiaceae bacterium]|nr:patatin-like phospholipase family protein [Casimicrobiaceae bacterium]